MDVANFKCFYLKFSKKNKTFSFSGLFRFQSKHTMVFVHRCHNCDIQVSLQWRWETENFFLPLLWKTRNRKEGKGLEGIVILTCFCSKLILLNNKWIMVQSPCAIFITESKSYWNTSALLTRLCTFRALCLRNTKENNTQNYSAKSPIRQPEKIA